MVVCLYVKGFGACACERIVFDAFTARMGAEDLRSGGFDKAVTAPGAGRSWARVKYQRKSAGKHVHTSLACGKIVRSLRLWVVVSTHTRDSRVAKLRGLSD